MMGLLNVVRSKVRSKLQNLGMTGGYQLGMITSFTWSLPSGKWCRGRDSNSHAQLRTTDFKSVASAIPPPRPNIIISRAIFLCAR